MSHGYYAEGVKRRSKHCARLDAGLEPKPETRIVTKNLYSVKNEAGEYVDKSYRVFVQGMHEEPAAAKNGAHIDAESALDERLDSEKILARKLAEEGKAAAKVAIANLPDATRRGKPLPRTSIGYLFESLMYDQDRKPRFPKHIMDMLGTLRNRFKRKRGLDCLEELFRILRYVKRRTPAMEAILEPCETKLPGRVIRASGRVDLRVQGPYHSLEPDQIRLGIGPNTNAQNPTVDVIDQTTIDRLLAEQGPSSPVRFVSRDLSESYSEPAPLFNNGSRNVIRTQKNGMTDIVGSDTYKSVFAELDVTRPNEKTVLLNGLLALLCETSLRTISRHHDSFRDGQHTMSREGGRWFQDGVDVGALYPIVKVTVDAYSDVTGIFNPIRS